MIRRIPTLLIALTACAGACSHDEGAPVTTAEHLTSPLSDQELQSAVRTSIDLLIDTTVQSAWNGHVASLDAGDGSCPARNAGEPDGQDIYGAGSIAPGESWIGECDAGSESYSGYMFWELASDASYSARALYGDATIGDGDAVDYEFDGEGTDHLTILSDGWRYDSDLDAAVTGRLAAGPLVGPEGYRADLYVDMQTGEDASFEADGDVLLYEDLFDGKFDSVSVDIEFEKNPSSAETCALEPRGTLSFRDADAHWYNVVFAPKYFSNLDYESDLSACDGCGTVYWQGYPQREVCLDFGFLWDALAAPEPSDFAL